MSYDTKRRTPMNIASKGASQPISSHGPKRVGLILFISIQASF